MGMYDSLYVRCSCGREIELQSKAGERNLDEWRQGEFATRPVPANIVADLASDPFQCPRCRRWHMLRATLVAGVELIPSDGRAPAKT